MFTLEHWLNENLRPFDNADMLASTQNIATNSNSTPSYNNDFSDFVDWF